MSDLINRQDLLKALDKFIPADPLKDDYTKGITVGIGLASGCVEKFSQWNGDSSQGLVKDLISRQQAIDAICEACYIGEEASHTECKEYQNLDSTWCEEIVALRNLPSAD